MDIFEYDRTVILIGHFMTSYEILRYPTISFWNIPDTDHWNIRGIFYAFVNLGQFEVSLG